MKALLLASVLLSSSAFADIYRADVKCIGTIAGDTSQVHESYSVLGMRLRSFQTARRDGTKAESLEVSNSYASPGGKPDFSAPGEVWYMGPMSVSNNVVTKNDLSGRGDNVRLTIKSSSVKNGNTIQILEGTFGLPNTVAGSYSYKLKCEAVLLK